MAKIPKMPEACRECGGSDFMPIDVHLINTSCKGHNQLGLHDVGVRFVIGCNTCSATILVLTEDQVNISIKPQPTKENES